MGPRKQQLKNLANLHLAGLATVTEMHEDYMIAQAVSLDAIDPALELAEEFEAKYGWVLAIRF